MTKRFALALLACTILTACDQPSQSEQKTADAEPMTQAIPDAPAKSGGTPFDAALAMEYLNLAQKEAHAGNWTQSAEYSDLGSGAAAGNPMPPVDPQAWPLKPEELQVFTPSYQALSAALESDLKTAQPEKLAEAQASYDCWIKRYFDSAAPERITECSQQFETAMSNLTAPAEGTLAPAAEAPKEEVNAEPAKEEPAPEKKEVKEEKPERGYTIYFAFDSSKLDKPAVALVENIAKEIKAMKDVDEVVVNGHTDTSGTEQYNMALSKRRAESVKSALVKRGIKNDIVHTFGFGETDPKVATGDGVKEAKNRRVQIFLEEMK